MRLASICLMAAFCAACSNSGSSGSYEPNTIPLTVPTGKVLQVETMIDPKDIMRGMMFRPDMKPDHGMLFMHQQVGLYPYWMYQTLMALDIVWVDQDKRIVEVVQNAQPCKTNPNQCPNYGGHEP